MLCGVRCVDFQLRIDIAWMDITRLGRGHPGLPQPLSAAVRGQRVYRTVDGGEESSVE